MRDLLEDFRKKSFDCNRDWRQDFLLPYSIAFSAGYNDYTDTLDAQKKADEAARERKLAIAMALLSIVGGSILTRVFAGETLKHVSASIALDFATQTSIKAAQKAANLVYNSPVAQFALGSAIDMAGGWISDELKKKLANGATGARTADTFSKKPFDNFLALEEWLGDIYRAVDQGADEADKKYPKDEDFKKALDILLQAPFFKHKPKGKLDGARTQAEVTLVLMMRYLLDQDFKQTISLVEKGRGGYMTIRTRGNQVQEMPNAPNYPKPVTDVWGDRTVVAIDDVGIIIKKKINEVYQKRVGSFFFIPDYYGAPLDNQDLRLAEKTLDHLNAQNLKEIASAA
jgi:hypothetical protein